MCQCCVFRFYLDDLNGAIKALSFRHHYGSPADQGLWGFFVFRLYVVFVRNFLCFPLPIVLKSDSYQCPRQDGLCRIYTRAACRTMIDGVVVRFSRVLFIFYISFIFMIAP